MNDVAKRLFSEKTQEGKRAEDQLGRINRDDNAGLIDISDEVDGFRYGSARLESLRRQTVAWPVGIEADTVESERMTGFSRKIYGF